MLSVIEYDNSSMPGVKGPWWEVMTPRGNLVGITTSAPEALRVALNFARIRDDDNIIFSPFNPLGK